MSLPGTRSAQSSRSRCLRRAAQGRRASANSGNGNGNGTDTMLIVLMMLGQAVERQLGHLSYSGNTLLLGPAAAGKSTLVKQVAMIVLRTLRAEILEGERRFP